MLSIFMSNGIYDADDDFMTKLYCRYRKQMISYAVKTVVDEKIAEDMVHEAFIRLIPYEEKLRSMTEATCVSYIRSTVRRVSLNFVMKKGNLNFRKSLENGESLTAVHDTGVNIEGNVIKKITALEIKECIKLLPQLYRDILYFKYLLGMKDEDIGESLGVSKDSVRQYIVRARRQVLEIYNSGSYRGKDCNINEKKENIIGC